jgi:hypothetical protein
VGEEEEFVFLFEVVEGAEVGWEGGDLEGIQAEDSELVGRIRGRGARRVGMGSGKVGNGG